jgi:hypothetical protein
VTSDEIVSGIKSKIFLSQSETGVGMLDFEIALTNNNTSVLLLFEIIQKPRWSPQLLIGRKHF